MNKIYIYICKRFEQNLKSATFLPEIQRPLAAYHCRRCLHILHCMHIPAPELDSYTNI